MSASPQHPIAACIRLISCVLLGLSTANGHAAAALAVASTETSVAYYWVGERSTIADAEQLALSRCRESAYEQRHTSPCRIGLSAEGPAYWAVVTAHNGAIGFGQDEIDWVAVSKARDNCAPLGICNTEASATWYDRVPKSYQILEPYPRPLRRHEHDRDGEQRERKNDGRIR